MSDLTPPPVGPPVGPAQPQPQPGPKRLLRTPDDRWLGGVCGGIGGYAGLDPTLVRVLAVIGGLFSGGTLLLAYVIAWIVMPAA